MAMIPASQPVIRITKEFFCLAQFALQAGWTPLYVASQNGRKNIAQLLLDHGADVDIADKV
jgi:ankyrin repeat protein